MGLGDAFQAVARREEEDENYQLRLREEEERKRKREREALELLSKLSREQGLGESMGQIGFDKAQTAEEPVIKFDMAGGDRNLVSRPSFPLSSEVSPLEATDTPRPADSFRGTPESDNTRDWAQEIAGMRGDSRKQYAAAARQTAQYADVPAVKEYMGNLETQASMDKPSRLGGIGVASLIGSDNPEFVSKVISKVDAYEKMGILSPDEADVARNQASVKPSLVNDYLLSITKPKMQKEQSLGINVRTKEEEAAAAQRGKAAGESQAIGSGQGTAAFGTADDLRTRFENIPEMKELKVIAGNVSKARDAMAEYKAGRAKPYEVDQSLAFFANKALDPNSVVMPGEFERFAKGLGYQSLQAFVEAFARGGLKLTDEQREGMLNIVERGYKTALSMAKPQYEQYKKLAEKRQVDAGDVVGGYDYIFNPKTPAGTGDKPRKRFNPATGQIETIGQ